MVVYRAKAPDGEWKLHNTLESGESLQHYPLAVGDIPHGVTTYVIALTAPAC